MSAAQVYRAFDGAGRLLYVGCSVDVDARLRHHEGHSDWWVFHERIERETFPSRDEAAEAESLAIANEHPRWNMTGRSVEHPDGWASSVGRADWLIYERDVARRLRRAVTEEAKLVRQVRKARITIAGIKAEVGAIVAGLEIDEDVA